MRGVGMSRATRGETGCRGGGGAGSDGSACSLLWWDLRPELLIVRYRRSPSFATCLTRRSGGEWRGGASPCQDFLGEAASINNRSTRSFPRHDTRRRALRGSTTVVAAPIARGWHRPWLASSPHPRARSPSHACTSALYTVVPQHPSQGHITAVTPDDRSSRWPPTDPSRPPPRKPRKTPGIRTAIPSTRWRAAPPPSATASPSPTSWSRC